MRARPDRLLSPGEVADLTGRSPRTVRRWISDGLIRPARLGRAVWIPESELLRALGLSESSDSEVPASEALDIGKSDACIGS
jgi:excisionase family DNA binding protein